MAGERQLSGHPHLQSFRSGTCVNSHRGLPSRIPAPVADRMRKREATMATATFPALAAEHLVKTYSGGRGKPPIRAVDGLGFEAQAGTVFGLLGPNGAGKSTTMKILS